VEKFSTSFLCMLYKFLKLFSPTVQATGFCFL